MFMPEQAPADSNHLAALRVAAYIAQYPQSMGGGTMVAANILSDTGTLSISTLANLKPNGRLIADQANRVHAAYDIDRTIKPWEARVSVVRVAMAGLEVIRQLTVLAADNRGQDLPKILRRDVRRPGLWAIIPEGIRKRGAIALEKYLQCQPAVFSDVKTVVDHQADLARKFNKTYRGFVLERYVDNKQKGVDVPGIGRQRQARDRDSHKANIERMWRRGLASLIVPSLPNTTQK